MITYLKKLDLLTVTVQALPDDLSKEVSNYPTTQRWLLVTYSFRIAIRISSEMGWHDYIALYLEFFHLSMSVHTDLPHCFIGTEVALYMIEPLFSSQIQHCWPFLVVLDFLL